jgi:hypothetical protein
MYISGTKSNFENRLHQLPSGYNVLSSYKTEGLGYTGVATAAEIYKWNREYTLKEYQFTQSGQLLTGRPFG